jgi:hypothetical protein
MKNIIKIGIAVFLTISFYKCTNEPKETKIILPQSDTVTHNIEPDSTTQYLTNFNSKSLSKAEKVFVTPGGPDDDGAVYLGVDSISVAFIFGLNRCEYSFPCINEDHKIKLKWNLDNGECDYKNSLTQTFGLKNYPKKNDVFAEIEPQGDSALKVTYLFTDFINEQNKKGRENKEFKIDTIFPTIFKIHDQ